MTVQSSSDDHAETRSWGEIEMSQSFLQRFLTILSSNVIGFLTGLAATPIIVRVLGPSEYGVYAFLLSVLGVLALLTDGGIFDGIRKFMAETDRSPDWQEQVFGFYARVSFVLIGLMGVLIFVAIEAGVLERYFDSRYNIYFAALAGVIAAKQFGAIVRSALMGLDLEPISESLQIFNKLTFLGVGLLLLLTGYGILGLLVAHMLGHLVLAMFGSVVLFRHLTLSCLFRRVPDSFPSWELLSFNIGSFVLFALYISILHLDIIMIQWFWDSSATGIYMAALTLAEFLWFVPRIVQIALLHSTSTLWSNNDHERIASISARMTRYTLAFTLLLVIGLAALAEPVVTTYYGQDFADAVGPLLILLPGALGFAVARPIFAIGQGNADLRPLNYATGGAALINLVGNFVLIPRYGIHGAALATSTGYLSMLVFHVWSARAIGFDPLTDLRVSRVGLTALLSAGAIFLLAEWITADLYALVTVPPVGFVVYLCLSVVTGVIDTDELTAMKDLVWL